MKIQLIMIMLMRFILIRNKLLEYIMIYIHKYKVFEYSYMYMYVYVYIWESILTFYYFK